ncbi:MFS transporter [Marinifilum sp.]|uniref:MFS transporter n=1 Tax=Marinifilum sp. TaxID=2033137 RepID=UPI003BAA185A
MNQYKWYPIFLASIVSIGGLLLGISANVSGASEFYRPFFGLKVGTFMEGLGVSIAMLATFIGTFTAGSISDKIGRKKSLLLAAFLFSFCTIGSGLAPNYTFFLISRFIGGLGIGICLVVVPMFIAEFSPSNKRGFLVSFNQLNVGIGFLLAYLINSIVLQYVSDPELIWRYMLGVGVIFPGIYFILLFFVPESPRWLMQRGREKETLRLLTKIGGDYYAKEELSQIQKTTISSETNAVNGIRSQWKELFSKKMRLIILIGFSVAFFQMASGFNSVMFFAPKIFRLAGFSGSGSFLQSNLIGITMVLMTVVSMFLIDRLGRKPLLLIGVSIMGLAMLMSTYSFQQATYQINKSDINQVAGSGSAEDAIIAEILTKYEGKVYHNEIEFFHAFRDDIRNSAEKIYTKNVAFLSTINELKDKNLDQESFLKELAFSVYSTYKDDLLDVSIDIKSILVMISILAFVIGFSISLGPITWALLSEIFPGSVRGLGISIASTLNGITSFLVVTILPIELEQLGASLTFLIYGILMLICIALVIKYYPETKGKSLEQIEKELVKID